MDILKPKVDNSLSKKEVSFTENSKKILPDENKNLPSSKVCNLKEPVITLDELTSSETIILYRDKALYQRKASVIADNDVPEYEDKSKLGDNLVGTFKQVTNNYDYSMIAMNVTAYSENIPSVAHTGKASFIKYIDGRKVSAETAGRMPVDTSSGLIAGATGLTLLGAGYQAYLNEQLIRSQNKIITAELQAVPFQDIVAYRLKNKVSQDKLYDKVTTNELVSVYKQQQVTNITKNTIFSVFNTILSLVGASFALGILFLSLLLVFGSLAAGIFALGVTALGIAVYVNKHRIESSIDKALEDPEKQKKLIEAVNDLNKSIPTIDSDKELISKLEDNKIKLLKTSYAVNTTIYSVNLASKFRYFLPILNITTIGVSGLLSIGLVGLSAALNYRERRSKLTTIADTIIDLIQPEFNKKSFFGAWIFGDTQFKKFIKANSKAIINQLNLPVNTKPKQVFKEINKPENKELLNTYITKFAHFNWKKKLIKFNNKLKPEERVNIDEIYQDKVKFKEFYKKYLVTNVSKYAYRDTLESGVMNTIICTANIALISSIFLPFIGLTVVVLLLGLTVSHFVAKHEKNVFKEKLEKIFANDDPNNEEQNIIHKQLDSFIDSWIDEYKVRELSLKLW